MPKITTDADLARFFLADFTSVTFSATSVVFSKTEPLVIVPGTLQTKVVLNGAFEISNGIISGSISEIVSTVYNDFDGGGYVFEGLVTIDGEGVSVEDLAAFQRSSTIGIQLLLSGNDDIYGYNRGHNGNDTLHADTIGAFFGGAGFDTLVFDKVAGPLNLDLNRDGSNFRSIEAFVGSKFSDDMRGTSGNDNLYGGAGNDLLVGRTGKDLLSGGSGNDRLIGSTGADILTGGSGKDVFVFERYTDSTRTQSDHITDFNRADDIIDLKAMDANTEKAGNQTFKWIGTDKFHGNAGELRYFKSGDRAVVAADIDGDKVIDFQLYLDKFVKLTALDFIL